MRGIFTAGVIDVLMENEIPFPALTGVSAGAAFGCNYKSNQPGRVVRYNLKYCREPRYCSFRSLIKTGDIFGTEFCYRKIPDELDPFDKQTFDSSPMKFYAVCSDVETAQPYYKRIDKVDDECYDWFRASASMPLVSKIVEVGGRKYLDGGITDSIPLEFMERYFKKNVVVLTRPRGYVKEPASHMWLFRRSLKKYPKMIEAIKNRHLMYNDELSYLDEQERRGNILLICPQDTLPIGRTEQKEAKMRHVYGMGRQTGEDMIQTIKDFL